jgi:hypothetical protein
MASNIAFGPYALTTYRQTKDFIMRLSPESRYTRMFCAMREPSAALLEQFVRVDYHRNMAFVADDGTLVEASREPQRL